MASMTASLFAGSLGNWFFMMNTPMLVPPRTMAQRNISISGCMIVLLHTDSCGVFRFPHRRHEIVLSRLLTPGAGLLSRVARSRSRMKTESNSQTRSSEEIGLSEVDDLVASAILHSAKHVEAEPQCLLRGNRWRHREFLTTNDHFHECWSSCAKPRSSAGRKSSGVSTRMPSMSADSASFEKFGFTSSVP